MINNATFINSTKWNAVKMIVVTAVQFIIMVLIGHFISPEDFGLYGIINVVLGLALLLTDAGFANAIIYNQEEDINKISSLFFVTLLLGGILAIILIIVSPLIATFYEEPKITKLLFLASLNLIVVPFGQVFLALARKNLEFKKITIVEIVSSAIQLITMLILAVNHMGVIGLILSKIFYSATGAILYFYICRNKYKIRLAVNMQEIKHYITFGFYQLGEKVTNYINSNIDYILIGKLLGTQALGIYTLAYQLMMMPIIRINPVLIESAFPLFAKMKNDNNVLNQNYYKLQKTISLMLFPICLMIFILAPEIIDVLYGPKWIEAALILRILSIKGILISLGNPINCILLTKGRPDLGFKWNVIAAVGMLITTLISVQWGIKGVAIGSLIFMVIIALPADFIMRKIASQASVKDYWINIRKLILINLIITVLLIIIKDIIFVNTYKMIIIITLIGIGGYLLMYRTFEKNTYTNLKQILLKRG